MLKQGGAKGILSVLVIGIVCITLMSGCSALPFGSAPEPITLRMGYRSQMVDLAPLVTAFQQEYPHVTIELVEVDRYSDEMLTELRSGDLDIFREDRRALAYAKEGLIRPLDEVQLDEWANIRADYYAGAWQSLAIAGKQWGIPASVDMLVVYVNLEHLQALDIEMPATPWSLFQFLELANQLNFPEGTPYDPASSIYGFCTTPAEMDPFIFIYLYGGQIVDDINNPTQATLDSPRTIEAVQWYVDLYNRYQVAPTPDVISQQFRQGGIYEAAIRGHCGLWLGWYSNRGGQDSPYAWQVDWAMLPLPHEEEKVGIGEVSGYYLAKDCAHPEEALTFLRFLADEWQAAGQQLPPRRSLAESSEYEYHVGEDIAAIGRTFSPRVIIIPQLGLGETDELEFVGEQLWGAITRIIEENLDPEQVLSETQYRVRDTFSE